VKAEVQWWMITESSDFFYMGIKQMIADQCLSRSDDYKKY
jgi:hypothetical protein